MKLTGLLLAILLLIAIIPVTFSAPPAKVTPSGKGPPSDKASRDSNPSKGEGQKDRSKVLPGQANKHAPSKVSLDPVKSLVKDLQSSGAVDNRGIENSLLVKLKVAEKALLAGHIKTAENILNALIHEIRAQSEHHITESASSQLLQSVRDSIASIENE